MKLIVFKTLQKYLGNSFGKIPNVKAGSNFRDEPLQTLYFLDDKNEV